MFYPLLPFHHLFFSDDEDEVLVFHVNHLDDDIGDDEVIDVANLEMSSPIVSVMDISSSSDASDHAPSSAIRRAGLCADAFDSSFNTVPAVTPTPTPIHTHTSARTATPTSTRPETPTSRHTSAPPTCDPTTPDGDTPPSGYCYTIPIPYHVGTSPIFTHDIPSPHPGDSTSHQPFHSSYHGPSEHFPTHYSSLRMATSDPYHPCHYPTYTRMTSFSPCRYRSRSSVRGSRSSSVTWTRCHHHYPTPTIYSTTTIITTTPVSTTPRTTC